MTNSKGKIVATLIAIIIVGIFIAPWLCFWVAYAGGWIAKITIGKYLVAGFALVGIDLPLDKIPLFAGVLGWIAGFFSSRVNTNNNNN